MADFSVQNAYLHYLVLGQLVLLLEDELVSGAHKAHTLMRFGRDQVRMKASVVKRTWPRDEWCLSCGILWCGTKAPFELFDHLGLYPVE